MHDLLGHKIYVTKDLADLKTAKVIQGATGRYRMFPRYKSNVGDRVRSHVGTKINR